MQMVHPILDQSFFLDNTHKMRLKEEFKIEPWTFEQHVGEAVIIPSGCPYQIRNPKCCVHVELEFVSPENVSESIQLIDEVRLLPKDHKAKVEKLEELITYLLLLMITPFHLILFFWKARESEPNSWEDTMRDELDRKKYPRMPWHNVHCALWGPPCRDIARHFVQHWNHAKNPKNKITAVPAEEEEIWGAFFKVTR
ncbi:hypothetical protein JHK87_001398 [Glycine soja]|nr:hypothetical protein JHK87_001398 [Glycine soja]